MPLGGIFDKDIVPHLMKKSKEVPYKIGIRATKTAKAVFITSLQNVVSVAVTTQKSPGLRSRRVPQSLGNTRVAS